MLGSMKKAILVKYAMTPNRIINKTSDFEYHIAKQSGLAIWLKKGGSIMSKTSMSVMEMGKSLGLGKTESYWLVHKKQFETRFRSVYKELHADHETGLLTTNKG